MVALLAQHSANFRPVIFCSYLCSTTTNVSDHSQTNKQHAGNLKIKTSGCHSLSVYHHMRLWLQVSALSVSNLLSSSLTGSRSVSCSGKRKITLIGSRLEFVEGVIHSHAPQKVQPPININYQVTLQSHCVVTLHQWCHPTILQNFPLCVADKLCITGTVSSSEPHLWHTCGWIPWDFYK